MLKLTNENKIYQLLKSSTVQCSIKVLTSQFIVAIYRSK